MSVRYSNNKERTFLIEVLSVAAGQRGEGEEVCRGAARPAAHH